MRRKENWPELLDEFLRERLDSPFEWGVNDCGLFAADCIRHLTGLDLAAPLRDAYHDEESARDALNRACGGGDLTAYVEMTCRQHRFQEVPLLTAQRGDLLLHISELGPTLLILSLDGWQAVGPSPQGLQQVPLDRCSRAWRIQ